MKNNTFVMALLGVAVMSGGLTFAIGEYDNDGSSISPTKQGGMINGHVTATLYDEDGNIKAYRQSDNTIVNGGLETIILQTFGNWTNTVANDGNTFNHTSATNHGGSVKTMAIGSGASALAATDFDLGSIAGFGGTCNNQTAQWQFADGGSNANPNTNSLLYIYTNVTFQGSAGCDNSTGVDEAGLYTSMGGGIGGTGTKAGHMFARQTFGNVIIGTSDSLKINWDISFQDT